MFLVLTLLEILLIFLFAIWAASMNLLDPVVRADIQGRLFEVKVNALSYCKYCQSTASATSKHCG